MNVRRRPCARSLRSTDLPKTKCPLSGECLASGIVYEAIVKTFISPIKLLTVCCLRFFSVSLSLSLSLSLTHTLISFNILCCLSYRLLQCFILGSEPLHTGHGDWFGKKMVDEIPVKLIILLLLFFFSGALNSSRFSKDDLHDLRAALRLPDVMTANNRTKWTGHEWLCVVLGHLSFPGQTIKFDQNFGRGVSEVSTIIFNATLDWLPTAWNPLLDDFTQHTNAWLSTEKMGEMCEVVNETCPLNCVWGLIDRTARPIARPDHDQRLWYSGHTRKHVVMFQSVMTAAGIVVHLFGPYEGRRHDADENLFNSLMSEEGTSVETGFPGISHLFAFLQHKENLKIGLQPVAQYGVVAALLYWNTEMRTCREALSKGINAP